MSAGDRFGFDREETTRSDAVWPGVRDEHGRVRWSAPDQEAAKTVTGFLEQLDETQLGSMDSDLDRPMDLDDLDVEPVEDTYPSTFEVFEHPLVGVVLSSRFEIRSLIGKGAHSFVFRAFDRQLGVPVALKVLRPELGDRISEFRERFHREATIAMQVSHPRIATVHDSGVLDQSSCFIAMELLIGRNLKHVLRDDGPMEVSRALPLFLQVADALSAAHEAGFIHRDIKPSNVFLLESKDPAQRARDKGRPETFKLLDFGLVKASEEEEVELTDAGSFVGTPQYAAPEQLKATHAGPRTDVYALGVLMFRVLTGALPFVGNSMVDLAAKHLDSPVPPMKSINPTVDVPPALEAIVQRCMEKDPNYRFADMHELMDELERTAAALHIAMPARTEPPPEELENTESVEVPILRPWYADPGILAAIAIVLCGLAVLGVLLIA